MKRPPLASAVYEGEVYHRRLAPREHAFRRRHHMLYLDLAELPRLLEELRWLSRAPLHPLRFRRAD